MGYNKLNNYLGWLVFLIATIVYFLTVESTASLWDCGEYITAAYKLEVGHPPGAPFFMLIGRIFSLLAFGNEADVALWINRMSALSSSLTILFLFWTITLLGKKLAQKGSAVMTQGQKIAILGSGFVGAMAYAFTESFWFSAVEGEVYAMSSLFTAVIFWAALKWDEEMTRINRGELSYEVRPLRWMVLIMFLFGLAIGVHLLGLLVLPAIAYIVMYNQNEGKEIDVKTFIVTGVIGVFVLGFIQEGIIPGIIAIASKMEIFFVNSLGLPFFTGAILFFLALITLIVFGLIYTRKKGFRIANTALLGLVMLLIGYGSFATIVIRSNANPPLDENNPENLVTLHAYLKREQYGSWPILYGEYFNSKPADPSTYGDRSAFYDKRYVITTARGSELAAFRDKKIAEEYVSNSDQSNLSIVQKYFETNKDTRIQQVPDFEQKTLFPRMFYRGDDNRTRGYKKWSGYDPNRKVGLGDIGEDNRPIPSFGNNLQFFFNYQVNWMYWRYFMWNFSGRQNDIQGHGDVMRGNWISGFDFIDNERLGKSNDNSPFYTQNNFSNNRFYFIPLVLGLIGLFFHYIRAPRDAFIVSLFFLFTGLAIVVYLNQKPFEPRERDYAYAASFYVFAIWIGLGVYGLYEAFKTYASKEFKLLGIIFAGLIIIGIASDANSEYTGGIASSMIVIGAMGIGSSALMYGLRRINFAPKGAALIATSLGLLAPILLGVQGWDDHDRSNRTPARALAWNYLVSVSPNGILYTNGDNDTFPLWYLQEVEGIRTDVRVANLSLMQTDWYTEQMMMRAYESDPLPIKFREDQILMGFGNTDYVLFVDQDVYSKQIDRAKTEELIKLKVKHNPVQFNRSINNFRRGLVGAIAAMTPKDPKVAEVIPAILEDLSSPFDDPGYNDYKKIDKVLSYIISALNSRKIEGDQELLKQLNDAAMKWTEDWDYLPIDIVMEFVRDDKNILRQQTSGRGFRFFPTMGFILPVNAENSAKAGIINETDKDNCVNEIRFNFRKGGMFRSDVRGLSREEVMMLDILANFEWNRGISFSSPGGSDVAKALYARGVLQNVGQIHTLSPLNTKRIAEDATEKLYKNVIELYDYGNLKEDGVLVDYYVRRHTGQYRSSYLDLAMAYGRKYQQAYGESQYRNAGDTIDRRTEKSKEAEEAANKVEEVIRHAMEHLPMDRVLDMGEPRPTSSQLPNGRQIFTDGVLPDFISILYRVEKLEYANELTSEYLAQIETLFNYFEKSHPMHAYENQDDFISMCMNFFKVFRDAYTENEDNHPLTLKASEMEDRLTRAVVSSVVEGLKAIETKETKGGRTRTRNMTREAQEFFELYQALLVQNGLMEDASGEN